VEVSTEELGSGLYAYRVEAGEEMRSGLLKVV